MATTSTTLSSAVTVTDTSIVVASATGFAAGNRLQVDLEVMQVAQNYTSGTTIPVLRGKDGSATAAHASSAAVVVGVAALDFPLPPATYSVGNPFIAANMTPSQITATGATGSTAAALPVTTPCLVSATGTSGAGVGIPTGAAIPGAAYVIKNGTTGVLKIYAVGGTIDGSTGTTALSLTATGNKTAMLICVNAGAWVSAVAT